jgi:uncharacterized protein (TIGR03437 family)
MKLARIVLGTALAAIPAVAATNITGISLFASDTSGNACTPFNSCSQSRGLMWATLRTPNLWVIAGSPTDPFVNGPTTKDAGIQIPLSSGTYTYTIYGASQSQQSAYFGLNLFFNFDDKHPKITVFAPVNTTDVGYFPAIAPSSGQTFDTNQALVTGSGSLTFMDGQTKITLTSFQWSMPNVYKKDRVGSFNTTPDGTNDYIGQFTLQVSAPPIIASGGVVNAASFAPSLTPGSLISIFGTDLASATAAASSTPLPQSIAGTSVTIGGKPAPLVFVSPKQINAQIPYEIAPASSVPVVVTSQGIASPVSNVAVVAAMPGIFQYGQSHAVVQNEDYSVNADNNPAKAGSHIVIYATGTGQLDNAVPTGSPAGADPLSRPKLPVSVTVGGRAATLEFAGLTPGFIGLMQVNVQIPAMAPGTYPVVVSIGGASSNSAMLTVN